MGLRSFLRTVLHVCLLDPSQNIRIAAAWGLLAFPSLSCAVHEEATCRHLQQAPLKGHQVCAYVYNKCMPTSFKENKWTKTSTCSTTSQTSRTALGQRKEQQFLCLIDESGPFLHEINLHKSLANCRRLLRRNAELRLRQFQSSSTAPLLGKNSITLLALGKLRTVINLSKKQFSKPTTFTVRVKTSTKMNFHIMRQKKREFHRCVSWWMFWWFFKPFFLDSHVGLPWCLPSPFWIKTGWWILCLRGSQRHSEGDYAQA